MTLLLTSVLTLGTSSMKGSVGTVESKGSEAVNPQTPDSTVAPRNYSISSEPPPTQWNKTYGGAGDDFACSVVETGDGGYALAGGTASFGAGSFDFWLVKRGPAFHDVAATNVTAFKTVVGLGYSAPINVTVANLGDYAENFNLTLSGNSTSINNATVSLTSGSSETITFTWNTTGFAKGNYTIWAYAWPVSGETDMDDNLLSNGTILVGVPCDVTGPTPRVPDGVCNMRDIGYMCNHFGTTPSSPNWDPNCDVTGPGGVPDGIVNMRDIGEACKKFGSKDP